MKDYDKIMIKLSNCHIFNIRIQIIYTWWAMSQKLPVNYFEWIENTSQFDKDSIKSYNEESD